jgi:hypothetical protein
VSTEKLRILTSALGSCYTSRDEKIFYCVYCKHHKKKLSVNISRNVFKCWLCDRHGTIPFLLRSFPKQLEEWKLVTGTVDQSTGPDLRALLSPETEKKKSPCIDLELPKEFISLVGNQSTAGKAARKYLSNRGITEADIERWLIGYCIGGEYDGRVVFPSFDSNACLNYFVARSYIDDWKNYMLPAVSKDVIFNELFVDFSEPITLVEGVVDAIKAGVNAVPILGSTLPADSVLFQKLGRHKPLAYVALDPDAEEKENRLISALLKNGIDCAKVEVRPYRDVGEMSPQVFQRRKDQAQLLTANDQFKRAMAQKLEGGC